MRLVKRALAHNHRLSIAMSKNCLRNRRLDAPIMPLQQTTPKVGLEALSDSADEEESIKSLILNDITPREHSSIATYQLPAVLPPYLRTTEDLPQSPVLQNRLLQPLAKSRSPSPTSQFTTFVQHLVTNCSSDTARKFSKTLPTFQKLIADFLNSNINNLAEYLQAHPLDTNSVAKLETEPSTSTSIPLPHNFAGKVRKRVHRTQTVQASSTNSNDPRGNYRRCPFCSDLCTASTALMWQDCSQCQFPVHFECDEIFLPV